jgi:DNA-directed RNA polymerase delta subunit
MPEPAVQGIPIGGDPLAAVREQEFSGMSVAKAAAVFLRKIGRHEKTATIIAAIRKGGVQMKSKNPITTVYTTLSRRPGFVSLGKNYWDLAERRPDLAAQEKKPRLSTKRRRRRLGESRVPKRTVVRMPAAEAASA